MDAALYLVATPIGNLNDISRRALDTLRAVDLIACEDTRTTGKLLKHFGISNKLISYHEHNERERAVELLETLRAGKSVAVVTDAGTPAISDPAHAVVRAAIAEDIKVVPIPGAAAFVNALVVSGLPTAAFYFGGFLPSRAGERRKRLHEAANIRATLVFYESPHRIGKSLQDCLEVLGNRRAAVARELTKLYEEIVRADLKELSARFSNAETRGEIVLVIDNCESLDSETQNQPTKTVAARVAELEAGGADSRAALKQAAREFGLSRSEAYRRLLADK